MRSGHTHPASDLKEEDRILLKDLRILTVTQAIAGEGTMTIKYYELARKSYDSLVVSPDQKVKILCDWDCPIGQELNDLI